MKARLTKTMSIILSVLMLLSIVSVSVSASTIVDSGICGENLTWTLDKTGTLSILGTGDMFKSAYLIWDEYKDSIKEINFSEGITSIYGFSMTIILSQLLFLIVLQQLVLKRFIIVII